MAATYYVSTTGSDSKSGSSSNPFKTISKAATVAHAGDTVYVRAGVYKQLVKISSKGSSSAWITFQPYPGESAVIDGTGTASDSTLVTISGQYVAVKNFEIRYATRSGVSISSTKYVRLENNTIHHSTRGGIYIYSGSFGGVTDIVVQGNTVYNNCLVNSKHSTTGGWPYAVGVHEGARVTFQNNIVYKNQGEGIGIGMSDYATVAHNTVYDNYSVEIYLDNARYSTVDGNLVYNTGDTTYYRSGQPANGISAANENSGTNAYTLNYDKVINNIVIGGKRGFYYGNYGAGGGIKNSVIANNTFYKATTTVLGIDSANCSGTVIANNIFYQTGSASLTSISGTGISYHNNCWYGGNPGSAAGSGDVKSNPLLMNPGGFVAVYYKLSSLSPCIKRGSSLSDPKQDFWQSGRTTSYDIGAHEFSLSPG